MASDFRKFALRSPCLILLCLTGAAQAQQTELAPGVIQKIDAEGRRSIVAGGVELADRTPLADAAPTELTNTQTRRGFILYRRAASDQVFRASAPRDDEQMQSLATTVSLNEKRHVQFALYALKDLGEVKVSASELTDDRGRALPAASLTIRPVRLGLWRNYWDASFREEPKLIDAPNSPTQLPAGESQQFWITVHVPASAAAGEYRSTVTVTTTQSGAATLDLNVRVLPFQLAEGIWWGVYYYPGFNADTPRDFHWFPGSAWEPNASQAPPAESPMNFSSYTEATRKKMSSVACGGEAAAVDGKRIGEWAGSCSWKPNDPPGKPGGILL